MTRLDAQASIDAQRATLRSKLTAAPGMREDMVDRALDAATKTVAVAPRKAKKADKALGASRLGGEPDLPGGKTPSANGYELRFIGQFDLADFRPHDPAERLPDSGLLSFFIGHPSDYDADPIPVARVIYTPAGTDLEKTPLDSRSKLVGVDLAPTLRLPAYGSHRYPDHEPYHEVFEELYLASRIKQHGFFEQDRRWEQAVQPDEHILLRLDADREIPYDLFEARTLYFIISDEALAQGDFSEVRVHEGAAI